jgi:hypothetical protein
MHSDCRGIPLKEGDTVVFSSMERSGVTIGTVVGFTPKRIRVQGQGWQHYGMKESAYILKVELPDA